MDENIIEETTVVEEIAKSTANSLKTGTKIGIIVGSVLVAGAGVYGAFVLNRKMKKSAAQKKEADDLAFRNAKVVNGDFIPETEVK